ncbi:MAG: hypothetical protein ACKO3T_26700 [Planctomycetaceae bacterium]
MDGDFRWIHLCFGGVIRVIPDPGAPLRNDLQAQEPYLNALEASCFRLSSPANNGRSHQLFAGSY